MNKYTTLRLDKPRLSFLMERRSLLLTLGLAVLCLAVMVISVGIGSKWIPPLEVIRSVFGRGDALNEVVVTKLRMPRIVIAVLVGASLAVAGAVLQGLVRNPLASPDVIGVTEGASLGAVLFLYFFYGTLSIRWMPVGAIIGAFAITALLYALAWKKGMSPIRLVLIGTGLSAAFKSIAYMLIISSPYLLSVKSITFMTGSIYGASWQNDVAALLPWVAVLLPLTWLQARHVNVQSLGEEVAGSAGANVQRQQLLLLLLSVALAGAAVAIGGAISFIGLIAPHMARKLVGPSFGVLMPVSALLGAIVLLVADIVARTAFYPQDVAAGVFTAAVGAPFFLFLLYKQRNS
ncbi:FecCD family ABC transporter permease [Cohnella thermotolerans]|uniref:FecCD family ABC transporter permease n=1 Tax=Cohnella thermotolerans TaxID=329858 RepID=UPI0004130F57|nr:iron ABC transporter permease [Cohnella thermotolerans]